MAGTLYKNTWGLLWFVMSDANKLRQAEFRAIKKRNSAMRGKPYDRTYLHQQKMP